jgi:WD40-like Beta Propeller Repeat
VRRAWSFVALLLAVMTLPAVGQVSPNKRYFTLHTQHFYIHFTAATEPTARRVAADAERAYAQLAAELHPPRGPIDVLISDDVDFSNGSATPFPTNRIVVYANPPIQSSSLRFTNDWGAMVITHELTHIFHLDRTRGFWRLGQYVFGRSPYLFPNEYSPAWLTEGLAVYEESRLTGAGRVEGSEHRMIARASAIDHSFPALSQASLAAPQFPFGEAAYAYGSLFVDYIARTRGAPAIRRFVEKSSADLPYLIDIPARQGLGVSFTRAYRDWRDSIFRSVSGFNAAATPLPGWHDLTREGVLVSSPRWLDENTLAYTGSSGREVYAAWSVDGTGRRERIGRRNSESPQVKLPDGGLLFAQLEFTSPYEIRSDLFVQRGSHQSRLTRDARLSLPDVRADGEIVAVQTVPGGTRLVRVSRDGRRIAPITGGGLDVQWNEPRWSHRGDRIAAIRWRLGGLSEVVVIDTAGTEQGVFASGHSVQATPTWSRDDSSIFYTSDRTGTAQIYLTTLASGRELRVSDAAAGLFDPQLDVPGQARGMTADGRDGLALGTIAAIALRGDGYHLGVAPCCQTSPAEPSVAAPNLASIAVDSSPAQPYSPWRQLWPRYWVPSYNEGLVSNRPRIGGETGGNDIIGRHAWDLTVQVPADNSGVTGGFAYSYAGLGLPVIDVFASRDWALLGHVVDQTPQHNILGEIRRRVDDAELDASWVRQRYRSAFAVTAGTGLEQYSYVGVPNGTIQLIDTTGVFRSHFYPRVLFGARYARTQAAPYSISPEDGFIAAATARERWRTDVSGSASTSIVGAATAYKSLDLPGFAHHVLALRGAAGWRDARATGYFEVGGTSGTPVTIIANYTVGEGARDFGVRGFAPASLVGTRAFAGSAEYRLPLVMPGRGLGSLPFFIQRSSLSLFTDYGTAWCSAVLTLVCTQADVNNFALTEHRYLGSYGAELNVNAAVLSWDAPYRFRFGVAAPYHDEGLIAKAKSVSVYFASGLSF